MTMHKTLIKIENLTIPLPSYFRSADFLRLKTALNKRAIYGEFNPVLTPDNFRVINPETASHRFVDFNENGERMRGTLVIYDTPSGLGLLEYLKNLNVEKDISINRRCNNDLWKVGDDYVNAPGFFAIDLKGVK